MYSEDDDVLCLGVPDAYDGTNRRGTLKANMTLGETGDAEPTFTFEEWGDLTPVPGQGPPQAGFSFAQKFEKGEEFVSLLHLVQRNFLSIKRL